MVVFALVTHKLSHDVLQQKASELHTLVAQVEQVLTNGPPDVHSLWAQPVPQADEHADSEPASVTHCESQVVLQQKGSLSQTALEHALQVGLKASP